MRVINKYNVTVQRLACVTDAFFGFCFTRWYGTKYFFSVHILTTLTGLFVNCVKSLRGCCSSFSLRYLLVFFPAFSLLCPLSLATMSYHWVISRSVAIIPIILRRLSGPGDSRYENVQRVFSNWTMTSYELLASVSNICSRLTILALCKCSSSLMSRNARN